MKQIISIFFALFITLQPLSKLWVYVHFKINQELIAKSLCVKKDIKNNTCQGKCYLKKQIAKTDQEDQQQSTKLSKEKIEVLYCNQEFNFDFLGFIEYVEKNRLKPFQHKFYLFSALSDIFHPPQFHLI